MRCQSTYRSCFSAASSDSAQCWLGVLNFVGALVLGSLLADGIAAELGGLVAFVQGIYWLLLGYGTAFLRAVSTLFLDSVAQ